MSHNETTETSDEMERIERAIDKEITKLQYYLEPADELIENNDITEMETAVRQASKINDKIMDLISQLEEMKLDSGVTPRTVRQWKKGKKDSYSHWIQARNKVAEVLKVNRQQIDDDLERRTWRPNESAILSRCESSLSFLEEKIFSQ